MLIVRSILILIFFLFSITALSQKSKPFTEDGKWGLKSATGDIILNPAFQQIGWSDGDDKFFTDVIGYQKYGFWGLLSDKGKPITSPLYKSVEFKGGDFIIASTLGKFSKTPLYGILDKKGKIVSSFRYHKIEYGYDDQYIVTELQENRLKTGVIVPDGEVLTDIKYQQIQSIGQSQYLLKTFNGYLGVSDKEGNTILENSYDELLITAGNDFLLVKDGLFGLSDRMGNFIHPMENKSISANRLIKFPLWTIRNQQNKREESILADSIQSIENNKLLVYRNDKKIIYNNNLALSGSFENATIVDMLENAVIVKSEEGVEVLNLEGNRLLNRAYDSIYFDDDYYYAYLKEKANAGWRLFSRTGTRISKGVYDELLPQSGNRIRFRSNGFWGILDFDGSVMVQPKYDTILPFENKRAIVKKLGLWGVIDHHNQWIIFPYEENLRKLNSSLFVSKKGYHIKFFDADGNTLRSITTDFHLLGEHVIIKGESGKLGIMDYDGSLLTSIAFDEIEVIEGGNLFLVRINSAMGVINKADQTIIPLNERLEDVIGCSENLIAIKLDGKFGFVDMKGQLIIANRYDDIQLFSEGLAPYKLNDRWGFLNSSEQLVIQPVFDEVLPFRNGITAVRDGDLWTLINQAGVKIESFKYTYIERLASGKYLMKSADGTGLNDENGQQILLPVYEKLVDIGSGRAIIRKNGKWGVINYDGTYVIPTLYKKVIYDQLMDKYLVKEN